MEEAWFGAYKAGWGELRRDELGRHLSLYTVIWPDSQPVEINARLRVEQERAGRTLKTADAWIAATALRIGSSLAAHDRDFTGIDGLTLIQAPA